MGSGSEGEGGADDDYSSLSDLRLNINCEDGSFSICFWLYLSSSTPFPSKILSQVHPEITGNSPFLVLDASKKMMLFPLHFLHKEAASPSNFSRWPEIPHASAKTVLPGEKWVHVGCEVGSDIMKLHINGGIVGEISLTSSSSSETGSHRLKRLHLVGASGADDRFQGFVHGVEVLSKSLSIKDRFVKDPPLVLSIDKSSAKEIEVDDDGIWNIVSGKASCRRIFSLDVVLSDAFGIPSKKEIQAVASLHYADDETPVEKRNDEEAPLIASCDGLEFMPSDKPSMFIGGRATFKLKISQLSSKCDNRLFRLRFDILKMGRYPFFEAFSSPIRCISRGRCVKIPTLADKKSIHSRSEVLSSGLDDESSELAGNIAREANLCSPSKRMKLGHENSFPTHKDGINMDHVDDECNSRAGTTNEDDSVYATNRERTSDNHEEIGDSPYDSEVTGARNKDSRRMSAGYRSPVSDVTIFKYCLGGLNERALLLKEFAASASGKDLSLFAEQVSLYIGCSHHGHQIEIAKGLVEEGTKLWELISRHEDHIRWENVVPEINRSFMRIARSSSRSLTHQDLELLRRIAGCQVVVSQENFEKMWCWLYPIAFTISRSPVNLVWNCSCPKWIEGFVTKEDAESALYGSRVVQVPGTFVLRFPTSRSWPHPDAGNLVVTYIGGDYNVHHRLLSLDSVMSSSVENGRLAKTLPELLLAEPELLRLGRILRRD